MKPRRRLAWRDGPGIVIGFVWLFTAAMKLIDLPVFIAAVRAHDLLPVEARLGAGAVIAAELLLGVGLVLVPRPRRLLVASAALVLAFAIYVLLIPDAIYKAVGCGCMGAAGGSGGETRSVSLTLLPHFLLLGLHLAAWRAHLRPSPADAPSTPESLAVAP